MVLSLLLQLQTVWGCLQSWPATAKGPITSILVREDFDWGTVSIISGRMEDDCAGPDGLKLLDYQRVRKQSLGLGPDGDFQSRDSSNSGLLPSKLRGFPIWPRRGIIRAGRIESLKGIEVVRKGICKRPVRGVSNTMDLNEPICKELASISKTGARYYQFPSGIFSEELDGEKLTNQCPSLTRTTVSWVFLNLLIELKTIRHKCIQGCSREMRSGDVLLYWLDHEL